MTASSWPARKAAVASVAVEKLRSSIGFMPFAVISAFSFLDLAFLVGADLDAGNVAGHIFHGLQRQR